MIDNYEETEKIKEALDLIQTSVCFKIKNLINYVFVCFFSYNVVVIKDRLTSSKRFLRVVFIRNY